MVTKLVGIDDTDESLEAMMRRAVKAAETMDEPKVLVVVLDGEAGKCRIFMEHSMPLPVFRAMMEVLAVAGSEHCHHCGCESCAKTQRELAAIRAILKADTVN